MCPVIGSLDRFHILLLFKTCWSRHNGNLLTATGLSITHSFFPSVTEVTEVLCNLSRFGQKSEIILKAKKDPSPHHKPKRLMGILWQ